MRHAALFLILVACTDELPVLSEEEQAEQAEWDGGPDDPEGEVIVVEGALGWPNGWFSRPASPVNPVDPGDTGGGYGGGGGPGGGADPHPIPAPRDCTAEPTHEQCYACCDWNVDKVWGERCRRIKDRGERRQCWADAESRRGDCQRGCPRLTITEAPWAP